MAVISPFEKYQTFTLLYYQGTAACLRWSDSREEEKECRRDWNKVVSRRFLLTSSLDHLAPSWCINPRKDIGESDPDWSWFQSTFAWYPLWVRMYKEYLMEHVWYMMSCLLTSARALLFCTPAVWTLQYFLHVPPLWSNCVVKGSDRWPLGNELASKSLSDRLDFT